MLRAIASQVERTRDAVEVEELAQAFDRDVEQGRGAAHGHLDLLLYFALGAFTTSVALSDLASGLHRDARVFFGGVAKAKEAAMAFLFGLRDEERVREARDRAIEAGVAHGYGEAGLHFRRDRKDDLPLALRGLVGCASVLYGDLDDVDVILVDTARMQVDLFYLEDFDARLPVIVRRSRVDLRRQTLSDMVFAEDDRRVFLARSRYATDEVERAERHGVERRIRGLPGVRGDDTSVRHSDIVHALREASKAADASARRP